MREAQVLARIVTYEAYPKVDRPAAYGHFGRELPEFTREATNKVDDLKAACGM